MVCIGFFWKAKTVQPLILVKFCFSISITSVCPFHNISIILVGLFYSLTKSNYLISYNFFGFQKWSVLDWKFGFNRKFVKKEVKLDSLVGIQLIPWGFLQPLGITVWRRMYSVCLWTNHMQELLLLKSRTPALNYILLTIESPKQQFFSFISSSCHCLNAGDGLTDSLHGLSSTQVIIVVLFLSSYPTLHALCCSI